MLTALNLRKFKKWALKQLYYELYQFMKDDFMSIPDCRGVHTPGNIIAPTSGGPCTQALPGGSKNFSEAKAKIYKARAEIGDIQIDVAEETGESTF